MYKSDFLAGAAQVKTTPALGTRINGDFVTHYAKYVHDDLYAKCLVFQKGAISIAMVVVDICIMPKSFIDETKRQIEVATGIPYRQIFISSTHTHAAGSVADVHLGSMDPAYAQKLPGLIVSSVLNAIQNLAPAKIAFGSVQAPEHLRCRRYRMTSDYTPINPVTGQPDVIKTNPIGVEDHIIESIAPTDPELGYLAVQDLEGRWIGLLANYSLHYVGDWENGTISADYFGVFAASLTDQLGVGDTDFVCIMSNGTSGDVNIWDFLNSEAYPKEYFAKSKLIGNDLALRVYADLPKLSWQLNPVLRFAYEDIEASVVKPTQEELSLAGEIVSKTDFEDIVMDQTGLRQLYAREQILLHEFSDVVICPIQAIQIGDGCIGTLPGEFFSETGLYLKKKVSIGSYFTISMANGNVGYVPPASEIVKGGYETWRCRYSCLKPETEATMREHLLTLIQSLKLNV